MSTWTATAFLEFLQGMPSTVDADMCWWTWTGPANIKQTACIYSEGFNKTVLWDIFTFYSLTYILPFLSLWFVDCFSLHTPKHLIEPIHATILSTHELWESCQSEKVLSCLFPLPLWGCEQVSVVLRGATGVTHVFNFFFWGGLFLFCLKC